jgi:iron-sulfur cluster assembly protein
MSISLTMAAANRVQTMLQHRGFGVGLRVGTKKSGCSGYAYVVDFADAVQTNDVVFESQGVKVIIDKDSLPQVDGLQLDYVKQNVLNEGFEFNNPNVKSMCGCGESFTV